MKDRLNEFAIADLAAVLSSMVDNVDTADFSEQATKGMVGLALKQRVNFLISLLAEYLPRDFEQAAHCLLKIVVTGEHKQQWGDFTAWPLVDYVSIYGLAHPKLSLAVLKHLTPLFSAEFAIRPFIEQHEALTYKTLLMWAEDDNEHVRRLASEGSRPRLPWGKQLKNWIVNPDLVFSILAKLKDDPSLYVRRSVANNLNDISKDHPDKVINLCYLWSEGANKDRQWVIKHALRTLVKSGIPDVFPLLGYTKTIKVNVSRFSVDPSIVKLGETISMTFCLQSNSDKQQKCVVDYVVDFVKANGKSKTKVFKWKNLTLQPNEKLTLTKKHDFKVISTRRYYQGQHGVNILLNGKKITKPSYFELMMPELLVK